MQRTKNNQSTISAPIEHIIIPISLFEKFLSEDNAADLISLCVLLQYKTIIQKTNRIKITTEEIQIDLQWSLSRVRKTKEKLKEFNLIEDVVVRNENRFVGNFIRFNYNIDLQTSESLSSRTAGNIYIKGGNTLQLFPPEKIEKKKERNTIPPTLEMVTKYCQLRKNKIDPQTFIDHYEARGWKMKGYSSQMKDWQAAVRTWEKNQTNIASPNTKFKAPFKVWDGMKYYLKPDGEYRNASGEPWID